MENNTPPRARQFPGGVRSGADVDAAQLSHSLKRLSLAAPSATPAPESPKTKSPSVSSRISSSPLATRSPARPLDLPHLRRTSSAVSTEKMSSSPALSRKTSTNSLRNSETPASPRRTTPRRSPSNLLHSSSPAAKARSKVPLTTSVEEPPIPTAVSIASDYFARELASHQDAASLAKTIVVLHDACYGHRYSRPKSTKSTLSMIVERPERIHASVLGISTAYVRLGGKHARGRSAPHPSKKPDGWSPFKIRKSSRAVSLTEPAVTTVHGSTWMAELKQMCESAGAKLAQSGKELGRADTNGGSEEPEKRKLHEGDLYLCQESLDAFQGALGAVCDGVDAVFSNETAPELSRAFVAIRPPGHHCSADYPSGFCWLNNVHVGIEYAAQTYGLTHAAIIDFDLHHGDGSQAIAWERNARNTKMPKNTPPNRKVAIGYYSLHDINSYPCEDGDKSKVQNASLCIENAHGQNIWNVHLQPWKTEAEFWELYATRYSILLEKARSFLKTHTARVQVTSSHVQARSAIFISAGFDASEWEGAGMQRHKVNVPTDFYARFTQDIVSLAEEDGTAANGRVISVLEGGYSNRALTSGVLSHLSGLCESPAISPVKKANTLSPSMADLSLVDGPNNFEEDWTSHPRPHTLSSHDSKYDTNWWSSSNLTALETLSEPPPPPPAKKARTGMVPTYTTPTQSFTHKVVDPVKFSRSISGTMRPVTPPP
ncbi:hypothetical protein LTR28_007198, partial [Elasticomyces elasticus]